MHYEIMNTMDLQNKSWISQKERIARNSGMILSLAPDSGMRDKLLSEKVKGINVIDMITKRTINYDESSYLYFNRVPTVTGAEIFMNEDFSIDIIADGDVIGHVLLWPNLRRHVKQVTYVHQNQQCDFIEEYASDGRKFSNIIYTRNMVQRIDFYNDQEHPVVRFYFYAGNLNYITVEDPDTHLLLGQYTNMDSFLAGTVASFLTSEDTVGISYMGVELSALAQSTSNNTLYLQEDPLDDTGHVKGNLMGILANKIPFVQNVSMNIQQFKRLLSVGAPTTKVIVRD